MIGFIKKLFNNNPQKQFPSDFNNAENINGVNGTSHAQSFLFPGIPCKDLIVSVILPVKDEALYIENTLDALRNQTDDTGNAIPFSTYEVLLLANNCTDTSFAIAKCYQQKHSSFQLHIAEIFLPKGKAHIGTVRRMLMDEAYRRLQFNNCNGIIASTDGDTEVDTQWIYHTIREINRGSDVIGGRIISKPVNQTVRRYYLQDIAYRYLAKKLETKINPCAHDPWPSHFQCYGASLAVHCSAYKKAGGLPALPYLEDAAFCSALYRKDAKIRCAPQVKVYTSSRRSNRVNIGFAAHLKHLENMHKEKELQYVEPAETLKLKFQCKQQLKACWNKYDTSTVNTELRNIAKSLCISPRWLIKKFYAATYFGALWEDTEARMYKSRKWRKKDKHILITDAIRQLREYINQ